MTIDSSSQCKGAGNTKLLPSKQISPCKRWCFTLHNPTEREISSIKNILDNECKTYIFSKEYGKSGKTPHLQGYCEFIVKVRPKSYLPDRTHWEKARGSRLDNVNYITKEGFEFYQKPNNLIPEPVRIIYPDRFWEREILEELTKEPDDRRIFWYWGDGGCGKTSFCKYLTIKHNAICLGGKGSDMRNGVVEYSKNNMNNTPKLVVINIPKTFNTEYISYEGMENVKDMYFYSGKYEGGQICGNPPYLFVFANEEPDYEKLSNDRWIVRKIKDFKKPPHMPDWDVCPSCEQKCMFNEDHIDNEIINIR